MKLANKIRTGISVAIVSALTLIASNPAQAKFISAPDSWPTNQPADDAIGSDQFLEKQTTLSLPKGRFGPSIPIEESYTTEIK